LFESERLEGEKMSFSKIDLPSLFSVLSLLINILIGFLYRNEMPISKDIGIGIVFFGVLFFVYALLYLRSGFLGETEPELEFLITKGPYRFCRHPLYLSFITMILGFDLAFRSIVAIVFTVALSIPALTHRARVEDGLLAKKFGKEWENYANRVGFLFPKLRKRR